MNSENDDYEEVEEEDPQEQSPGRRKIAPPIQRKKQAIPQIKEEELPNDRYVAFRIEKQEGVMDTETDIPVGIETNVILAAILNKLNNIEISYG